MNLTALLLLSSLLKIMLVSVIQLIESILILFDNNLDLFVVEFVAANRVMQKTITSSIVRRTFRFSLRVLSLL